MYFLQTVKKKEMPKLIMVFKFPNSNYFTIFKDEAFAWILLNTKNSVKLVSDWGL